MNLIVNGCVAATCAAAAATATATLVPKPRHAPAAGGAGKNQESRARSQQHEKHVTNGPEKGASRPCHGKALATQQLSSQK